MRIFSWYEILNTPVNSVPFMTPIFLIIIYAVLLLAYFLGFYRSWLVHGTYRGKEYMTATCSECKGHGMFSGFGNNLSYCATCEGEGRRTKKGFRYWFMNKVFKWTHL